MHRIGGQHCAFGLRGDRALQSIGIRFPAAGVDYRELAAAPQRLVRDAVPGHPRDVLDHRLTAPDDPVTRVDLPNIGRPTTARVGVGTTIPSSSGPSPSAPSQPLNSLSSLQVPSIPGIGRGDSACIAEGVAHVFVLLTGAAEPSEWRQGWPPVRPDVFGWHRLLPRCLSAAALLDRHGSPTRTLTGGRNRPRVFAGRSVPRIATGTTVAPHWAANQPLRRKRIRRCRHLGCLPGKSRSHRRL